MHINLWYNTEIVIGQCSNNTASSQKEIWLCWQILPGWCWDLVSFSKKGTWICSFVKKSSITSFKFTLTSIHTWLHL